MNIRSILDPVLNWTKHNSNVVLSGIAVGGVVTTAILAFKAGQDIEADKDTHGVIENPVDQFKATWHYYVPPVASAALTITAVVCAHKANVRQQGAIAAALAISEKSFMEYRERVAHVVGQRKADQVHEEVVEERIKKTPPSSDITKNPIDGKSMCYDVYTGRYFWSTRQIIDDAINKLNHQIVSGEAVSLNELYDLLGLENTELGDQMGWNSAQLIDLEYSSHLADYDMPALAFRFKTNPGPNYWKNYR